MKKIVLRVVLIVVLVAVVGGTYYYLDFRARQEAADRTISGTVEAVEVGVASEIAGKVTDVLVEDGQVVQAGDLVYRLDDSLLQAQRDQAAASLETAQAGLATTQVNLEAAQLQLRQTLQAARLADQPTRAGAWEQDTPDEFDLPGWYYTKAEMLSATDAEAAKLEDEWQAEQANLERLLDDLRYQSFLETEERLNQAQVSYQVADAVLLRADVQSNPDLVDIAQEQFDAANAELQAAQEAYDRVLTTQEADDILEGRARVAVARESYYTALDQYYAWMTSDDSLEIDMAQMAVDQAQAAVDQAETTVTQAQAQIDLVDLQISKTRVVAPVTGVVTNRNLEPGEVVVAGAAFITIGQIDDLTLTVYLPEDQYGSVRVGDRAEVHVDSFPAEVFEAQVTRIADQAEYTPRNVNTTDGRRTTVFAIELSLDDISGRLKPGMPADVEFNNLES